MRSKHPLIVMLDLTVAQIHKGRHVSKVHHCNFCAPIKEILQLWDFFRYVVLVCRCNVKIVLL